MRMLLHIEFPLEPFNSFVRDGSIGAKMQKAMEACKPEAAYFCAPNGKRGGVLVVNLNHASEIPTVAEPWFLTFQASVRIEPAMTAEDLSHADLAGIGKHW